MQPCDWDVATEVVVELIDFRIGTVPYCNISLHQLKEKMRHPKRFCLESFNLQYILDLGSYGKPNNVGVCSEYSLVLVNTKDKMLIFDLQTRMIKKIVRFHTHLVWFCLDKHELYVTSDSSVLKFDFKLILEMKEGQVDTYHPSFVWENSNDSKFSNVWGINVFENLVFVCDYFQSLTALDKHTGQVLSKVKVPDFEFLDNVEFSPEGEMFVCKRYFIEKLIRNASGEWTSAKKIGPQIENDIFLSRPYSMFFEKSSQLLFVSDADRMIFVFDNNLNLVKYVLNYDWEGNSGIFINTETVELLLCDTRKKRILVYK